MMVSALLQTSLDKLCFMNFKIILLFYLTESGDEKKKYPIKHVYRTILERTQEKPRLYDSSKLFQRRGLRPWALSTLHVCLRIWKRSFLSPVRSIVHTNPSRKQSFSKTLFRLEKFEYRHCVVGRTENILKTKILENDDVMTITFPCLSFNQTQIQNSRWLL